MYFKYMHYALSIIQHPLSNTYMIFSVEALSVSFLIFWQVVIMIRQVYKIAYSRLFRHLCQLVKCYINLSNLYVDLWKDTSTCQLILLFSVWHCLGKNTFLKFILWEMNKWQISINIWQGVAKICHHNIKISYNK